MKRNCAVFILMIVITGTRVITFGQAADIDTSFNYFYNDAASDLIMTPSGNLILVGVTDSTQEQSMLWLRQLNDVCDSVWSQVHEFEHPVFVRHMLRTLDDHLLMTGSLNGRPRIFKTDLTGNLVTDFGQPDTPSFFQHIFELPNSELLAIQTQQSLHNRSKLMRMDQTGNILWDMDFIGYEYNSIASYDDGHVMISGWDNDPIYPHPFTSLFTITGDSVFTNECNEVYAYNYCMVRVGDDYLLGNQKRYLSGKPVANIMRLDSQGDFIWKEDMDSYNTLVVRDIIEYNSYIITCSEVLNTAGTQTIGVVFSSITSDGMLIGNYYMSKVAPRVNAMVNRMQMLYVTGSQYMGDSLGRDIFITRINIDSLLVPTVTVPENMEQETLSVFPNPAKDKVSFYLADDYPAASGFAELISWTGQVIIRKEITGIRGEISLPDIENGLYLLRVTIPGRLENTKKILVYQ